MRAKAKRKRIRWAWLVLLFVPFVLFGGGKAQVAEPTSAEEAVRAFVEACKKGDWKRAKYLLTESSRKADLPLEQWLEHLRDWLTEPETSLPHPLNRLIKVEFEFFSPHPTEAERAVVTARPRRELRLVAVKEKGKWRVDLIGSLGLSTEELRKAIEEWQARELSNKCLSRLKQLALAMRMYLNDWDGRFPPADRWCDALRPYVVDEKVFTCPVVEREGKRWGYAMNWKLSRRHLSEVENLARTVVIYETSRLVKNACGDGRDLPPEGRHKGWNGFAFVDGHVQMLHSATGNIMELFRLRKSAESTFSPFLRGGVRPVCR